MTPFLALVLAGFAFFIVVLGAVTTQGWIAAVKARRAPRPAARPAHAELSKGAHVH